MRFTQSWQIDILCWRPSEDGLNGVDCRLFAEPVLIDSVSIDVGMSL
jgi:hypothetical protein